MNQTVNSTTYLGSINVITGKDETDIQLFENVLHPSDFTDALTSRKLSCVMMSHFFDYIVLPENVMLNLDILCIDKETETAYPVLSLTGNCDTVQWMLENEISILNGQEQSVVQEKKSIVKKDAKAKNEKKVPTRPVRSHTIGFEYANRN